MRDKVRTAKRMSKICLETTSSKSKYKNYWSLPILLVLAITNLWISNVSTFPVVGPIQLARNTESKDDSLISPTLTSYPPLMAAQHSFNTNEKLDGTLDTTYSADPLGTAASKYLLLQ